MANIAQTDDWRDVAGYEGHYRVSRYGAVVSLKTLRPGLHGVILKGSVSSNGYRSVGLHKGGKQTTIPVHQLVASAFVPRIEGKTWVNHKDATRTNDRWDNLEWCTPKENNQHGLAHGVGSGRKRKLTGAQFAEVRARLGHGEKRSALAKLFGVSTETIRSIALNRHHPHHDQPPAPEHLP